MKPSGTSSGRSWEKEVSSSDLFLAGLLMMVAFLVNPSTLLRVVQFLLFWFYAYGRGKKNRPLITLSVMGGIVLFNLLVPYGRVLAAFGAFRITQGALLGGLHKALTVEGLIMLSKASIRADLCLPGFFGSLLGESFRIFEGITQRKALITRKHFIEGIDQLMLELSAEQALLAEHRGSATVAKPRRTLTGMLLLGGAVVPIWGLTILGLRFGSIL
jgi:heptaprenyl diphosphate synthase